MSTSVKPTSSLKAMATSWLDVLGARSGIDHKCEKIKTNEGQTERTES